MRVEGNKITISAVDKWGCAQHVTFEVDKEIAEMAKDAVVAVATGKRGGAVMMIHVESGVSDDIWPAMIKCENTPESMKKAFVEGMRINKKRMENQERLANRLANRC